MTSAEYQKERNAYDWAMRYIEETASKTESDFKTKDEYDTRRLMCAHLMWATSFGPPEKPDWITRFLGWISQQRRKAVE